MSEDAELDSFLSSLSQQLTTLRQEASHCEAARVLSVLDALGATDLARETDDLPNSLQWLSSVVSTCASFSPGVAFALAGRFVAQRVERASGTTALTAGIALASRHDGSAYRTTVPALLAPTALVLLDRGAVAGRVVRWDSLSPEEPRELTGLTEADLRTLRSAEGSERVLTHDEARVALFEYDLLTAAVALGILHRAVAISDDYATTRRQFGEPVARFAGLAAILVDMRLRASTVAGLLAQALESLEGSHELAAVAGRSCVETCLDAIQVHGGYGYIDEYPAAHLLRDALSLRARGGGRRSLVAAVAAAHLHSA